MKRWLIISAFIALGFVFMVSSHGAHNWRPFIDQLGTGLDWCDFVAMFCFWIAFLVFKYGSESKSSKS